MTSVKNEIVCITGGASGLGKGLAHVLAKRGARVVLCDINEEALNAVVEELKSAGHEAWGFVCDLSDREAIYAFAERVKSEVGTVTVLVNNAGIVSGKEILDIDDRMIEKTFQVNSLAPIWTTRAFLPGMLEQNKGHIVTIASAAGLIGVRKMTDYSASKFAAVGFAESLRVELAQKAPALNTTLVCPFFIDTGMFDGVKTRFSLLLPILKPEYVINKIARAIERNQKELIMPNFVKIIPLARVLPTFLFDAIANFFGVNASMEEFVGRKPAEKHTSDTIEAGKPAVEATEEAVKQS